MRWDSRAAGFGLLGASMAPSLAWALLDRQPWTYDPAWYGARALALERALLSSPAGWAGLMISVQKEKAPGIVWLGQFFVPLGTLLGSSDLGLMLFIILTQSLTLVVLYLSLERISGGRRSAALCGALSLGAGPLFVGLSHEYYTEPLQALAVAWFVLIMADAPGASRVSTLGRLVAAAAFAMAAKVSSPVYCVGPGAAALFYALGPGREASPAGGKDRAVLASGALFFLLVAAWYLMNRAELAGFLLRTAPRAPSGSFRGNLGYWLGSVRLGYFYLPFSAAGFAALMLAAAYKRARRPAAWDRFDAAACVAAGELLLILGVFSLHENYCQRYLLPVFVFIPVLIAWGLARLGGGAALLVGAWACLQTGVVHARALGALAPDPRLERAALRPVDRGAAAAQELEAVLKATCGPPRPDGDGPNVMMIGVSLLRLNAETAGYYLLQRPELARRGCEYWSADSEDFGATWAAIERYGIRAVVLNDPELKPVPESQGYLNLYTARLRQRLEADPRFSRERLAAGRGVLVFRRRERRSLGAAD